MKKRYLKAVILLMIASLSATSGFAQFSIDAHYRPRFEIRNGYQKLGSQNENPAVFITQRTRLSFSYETDKLKLRFTPQDVRVWGDENLVSATGVMGDTASLEMFEGFAELKVVDPLWISAGRQQLRYNNDRILGDRNWNQTGIAYDAFILKYSDGLWKAHIGVSWNSKIDGLAENNYPSNRIKSLNFLWINRQIAEKFNVSFMQIASGITKSDTTNAINFRHTTGLYTEMVKNNWSVWGDLYYQYGKNKTGINVSAFLFDVDAAYKIDKIKPGIGFAYLSGNSKTGSSMTTDHLFDVLYGTRHKFFGAMDYFRDFPKNTSDGGLVDFYVYLDYQLSKKVSIKDTPHYFWLAQTNEKTLPENKLGFENDLILKYNFATWGVLEGGYCFFLPTETLTKIQKVNDDKFSHFFYVMVTLTPNLLKQN